MEEICYSQAFDFLPCVPSDKVAYCIPMELLTPRLARKMASVPNSVYIANFEKVVESYEDAKIYRVLLKFGGDCVFEAFARPSRLTVPSEDTVICYTPRVAEWEGKEYVVLDLIAWTQIIRPNQAPIGIVHEDTDPSDLARDAEELDRAVAHHEATT